MLTSTVVTFGQGAQDWAVAVLASLEVPTDSYSTQHEAMTHAHSVASRTRHRMSVYPLYTTDQMYGHEITFVRWRIRLGKGALS